MKTKRDQRLVCWLKYHMALKGSSQADVARLTGYCQSMVSKTIRGLKTSAKIDLAVANVLGYRTFERMEAAFRASEGGQA